MTPLKISMAREAGGLAALPLKILFQVCLGASRLHAPVSRRDYAIS
jgi:hypothetical protein